MTASSGYRCVCILCGRKLRWMEKDWEAVESALGTRGRFRAVSDVIKAPYQKRGLSVGAGEVEGS